MQRQIQGQANTPNKKHCAYFKNAVQ